MKRTLLLLTALTAITLFTSAQDRGITRGAEPGELYMTNFWWGRYNPYPPYYDTLRTAVYRLTENGKKLTIQYETCYFTTNPEIEMYPSAIIADKTQGALYNKVNYSKNSYTHTALWFSDDYGISWIQREENMGANTYFSHNLEGLLYRAASAGSQIGTYNSYDYAYTFSKIRDRAINAKDPGLVECEFYTINLRAFYHTFDCFENYSSITIPLEYAYGNVSGLFPDVYRGALPGEVYISSWFPGSVYKVSFSDDYGENFRHVYICDSGCRNPYENLVVM